MIVLSDATPNGILTFSIRGHGTLPSGSALLSGSQDSAWWSPTVLAKPKGITEDQRGLPFKESHLERLKSAAKSTFGAGQLPT